MLCRVRKVHDVGNDECYAAGEKYLLVHAEVICHGASHENSGSNADVPAAKVRAVCSPALVVASEVHAHGLVTGEDEPEACADEECGQEKCYGTMAKGKDEVSDNVQCHAHADKVDQIAAIDESPGHDAVHDESGRDKCIKPTCAADAEFVCINGDVVCDGAVGKSDEDEVCKLRNRAGEEKSVERKRCALFLFAGLYLERLHKHKADNAKRGGNGENDSVAECFVKKHAGHGTGGEG